MPEEFYRNSATYQDFILEDDDGPLEKEYTNILNQMPNPSAFTDDEDMYRSIEKWRNYVIDEVLLHK